MVIVTTKIILVVVVVVVVIVVVVVCKELTGSVKFRVKKHDLTKSVLTCPNHPSSVPHSNKG